jgi:hypothetical protein
MSELVKGIVHVHSDFSRDGLCSIADLADFARDSGFRFVGLTDHAEDVSPQDMKSLKQECEAHSDESCLMIPGLEFRCTEDIHILGLGITKEIINTDPIVVAREIQALGGLAILAHPGRNGYQCPAELFRVLNGIEIWNAGYDGRFVPPLANLRLLQEARTLNTSIMGFGGADLHGFHTPPGIVLELSTDGAGQIDAEVVLQGLRRGGFSVCSKYLRFSANNELNGLMRFPLWGFRKVYELSKAIRHVTLGET